MRSLKITNTITNREAKSLDKYFNEISKYDVLTVQEEVKLFKEYQNGNEEALSLIVKHNLRFVVSVAKQYSHGSGLNLGDAINEGNMGLIKAAKKFDVTRGFKFISYAVWWIRQAILAAYQEKGRKIKVPPNLKALSTKINRANLNFLQIEEREASIDELSEFMDLKKSKIQTAIKATQKFSSIDAPIGGESDFTMATVLTNTDENPPDHNLNHLESLKVDISRLLNMLNERERSVLQMHYGIGYDRAMKLTEIGDLIGLSRERVRQLHARAIRRLSRNSELVKVYA